MNATYALETQMQFIAEKRNKPYKQYGAVSIASENWIWVQEASGSRAPLVSRMAGA